MIYQELWPYSRQDIYSWVEGGRAKVAGTYDMQVVGMLSGLKGKSLVQVVFVGDAEQFRDA